MSVQDRKDFDKFTKFLIFKSIQIIVQSRLGEKIKTKSKAFSTGADWFNLSIRDNNEVQAEAKRVLAGQKAMLGENVCVEISLRTSEGDSMVLETWYIVLDSVQCDINAKTSYTVYNRMSTALKSLLSVSRVTPAYKLSRRQGTCASDYVICYRIYLGEPQFFFLGDGYEKSKVGTVPSPFGTVTINLAYRTKLLISPQKTGKEVPFDVKDDHFKQDGSPKKTMPKPCALGHRRNSSSELDSAVQSDELCSTTFSTSPSDALQQKTYNNPVHQSQPIKIDVDQLVPESEETRAQSAPEKQTSFRDLHKVGAFVPQQHQKDWKKDSDDTPFLSLLTPNKVEPLHQPQPGQQTAQTKTVRLEGSKGTSTSKTESSNTGTNISDSVGSESNKSASSHTSAPEDFVMVELKTPFAGTDVNTDLGKFYRECQGAPALTLCEEEHTATDTLEQITGQLDKFEANMKDFDEFVSSLQEDNLSESTTLS